MQTEGERTSGDHRRCQTVIPLLPACLWVAGAMLLGNYIPVDCIYEQAATARSRLLCIRRQPFHTNAQLCNTAYQVKGLCFAGDRAGSTVHAAATHTRWHDTA